MPLRRSGDHLKWVGWRLARRWSHPERQNAMTAVFTLPRRTPEVMGACEDSHRHGHHHGSYNGSAAAFRWGIVLNSGLTALHLAIGFSFGSLA
jgi:hypothetical protein